MTCFGKDRQGGEEVRVTVQLLPFSQIPSAENIQYVKVPHFGVKLLV